MDSTFILYNFLNEVSNLTCNKGMQMDGVLSCATLANIGQLRRDVGHQPVNRCSCRFYIYTKKNSWQIHLIYFGLDLRIVSFKQWFCWTRNGRSGPISWSLMEVTILFLINFLRCPGVLFILESVYRVIISEAWDRMMFREVEHGQKEKGATGSWLSSLGSRWRLHTITTFHCLW